MHKLLIDLVGYSCRKAEPSVLRKRSIVTLEGDSIVFTLFNRVQTESIMRSTKESVSGEFKRIYRISDIGTLYAETNRGKILIFVPRGDTVLTYVAVYTHHPQKIELCLRSSPRILTVEDRTNCKKLMMGILGETDPSEL